MNTIWSDYLQTTEELYISRSLRFRLDNRDVWLERILVKDGMDVLEVGCAGGLLLQRIKQCYPHVRAVGLDRDSNHIAYAKGKAKELGLSCSFVEGDAIALPFENEVFDATLSHAVIEHVPTSQFLNEQHRVLRKGGSITIMVAMNKYNVSPEDWKTTDLIDNALKDKKMITETYGFAKYELALHEYPHEMERAGFNEIDIQFASIVDYAPDNFSVSIEDGLLQINANRKSVLESINKAEKNCPEVFTPREKKRLVDLVNSRFDRRIAQYNQGEKIWDIGTSTIMFITGRK